MNVKDLVLAQPLDCLLDKIIELFTDENDDLNRVRKAYKHTIAQIAEIIPIESPNELMFGTIYKEYDDGIMYEYPMFSLIHLDELEKMRTDGNIQSFEDSHNLNLPASYSLMFIDWEEILGYKIALESFDYVTPIELAACLLDEITFFGYDYEKNKERCNEEEEELDRRVNDIKEHPENLKTLDLNELKESIVRLRKESGEFDGKTDEEIKDIVKKEDEEYEIEHKKNLELMLESLKERYEILKILKKNYIV